MSSRSPSAAYFIILGLTTMSFSSPAQDSVNASRYRAWFQTMDTTLIHRIQFVATADSGIWYRRPAPSLNGQKRFGERIYLPAADLRLLQFNRRGRTGPTLAVMLPLSLLAGLMVDWSTSPYYGPGGNAAIYLASLGLGVGLCFAIANSRQNIRIDGRVSRYLRLRNRLNVYSE
jgi:hypothetical protein